MPAEAETLKTLDYQAAPVPVEAEPFKVLQILAGIAMLVLFFAGIFAAVMTIYWIVRWPGR